LTLSQIEIDFMTNESQLAAMRCSGIDVYLLFISRVVNKYMPLFLVLLSNTYRNFLAGKST